MYATQEDRVGLLEALSSHSSGLRLLEFDLSCDRDHDSLHAGPWARIQELLREGRWLLYCTLPASTFSRSRHHRPGPPPLRSHEHPYGFPWLRQSFAQQVHLDNDFIFQAVASAHVCFDFGSFFVFDHPERLGVAHDQVLPASPWEWAEVLDLISRGAVTFALCQCHYGALTSKPTRFLSNLPSWRAAVPHFPGLPSLDDGRYRGPLPPRCGHKHADLLRSQPSGWQSGNIARFTPELCAFVARAALAVAPQEKGAQHSPPATTDKPPAAKNLSSPPSESASPRSAAGVSSGMVTGEAASSADPESFASSLLKAGVELTRSHLLELYKLLPREKPPRSQDRPEPGTSFSIGCYYHAGSVGLRHHTKLLPNCSRLLCAYWKQVLPLHTFTTITLLEDVQTPLHRDGRNGSTHNAILAVSDFEQGGLWLEDEHGDETRLLDGQELRGKVHQITKDPFVFEARDRYHCTEPWKGHRLVMVAFTVPGYEKLESSDLALVRDLGFVLDGKSQLEGKAVAFRPELCCNRGNPINVMWAGDESPFTDGFGLCSPSRWVPSARGQGLPEPARRLAAAMHKLVKSFVLRVLPNVERTAMELVLGRFTSSPFAERDMTQLRQQWVGLLGDSGGHDLLVVPERQPFYLPALARTAELLGDPDWEVITQGEDNFCTGVPLGCDEVLPQVPQVFDFKHKSRTLDESEFDWDRTNYKSAHEFEGPLLEKFREEEQLGRMFPTTLGALKEQFGSERIRIASLGAIGKPDGTARPIHDGTHGVQVNNAIRIESQQAVPGPAELSFVVDEPIRRGEVPFCISADVSAAHRLSKVRRRDWPYLACRMIRHPRCG